MTEQNNPNTPGAPEDGRPGQTSPSGGRRRGFGRAEIENALTPRLGWHWVERYATIIGFIAMFAIFWILKPHIFGTWESVKTILDQAAVVIILAVGLTVVMTTNEFDLSFPGLVGLCAVVAVKAMASGHASPALAVVLALATGLAGGLLAGALVATKRTSSFITTLALNTIWGGLALGVSGGGGSTIVDIPLSYTTLTSTRLLGITLPVYYALALAIVAAVVLRATVFGRNARAIGENAEAARLSGIRLSFTRVGAFAFMGVCAGIVAVILSSKTAQYTPNIASGLFIPPFVAAFFGISVLAVGRFNVFGTVVGALFIGTLQTGLIVIGAQAWVGEMVVGAALLTILFISAQTRETR
jgi:ribose/xylose/arabinose/galactoside ABC-type transport system permease subunit